MAKKYVYYFGDGKAEGTSNMKELLGGKGAGLAEMTNLGISVPPRIYDFHRSLRRVLQDRQAIPSRNVGCHIAGAQTRGTFDGDGLRRILNGRCWFRSDPVRAPQCRA